MRLTESKLRQLIRLVLQEQVVGYNPPKKSSQDAGYMQYGDLSEPGSDKPDPTSDSEEYEQLETQKQVLTKQRQKATNRGNAPQSNYDARKLSKLSSATG